jgi:energy-coupling factor transporter ATP-binding protein EcfA2
MRVARIELKEIGPFEDAVLEIPAPAEGQRGELVIFEGPNGCGKTTIAEVIACAAERLLPAILLPSQEGGSIAPALGRLHSQASSCSVFLENGAAPFKAWTCTSNGHDLLSAPELHRPQASALMQRAAFAYKGHQETPDITTSGPSEIRTHPIVGALSFGRIEPASAHFGQLLTNLDYEIARALKDARNGSVDAARREELERIAASRQSMLDGIERALSDALARTVKIDFPFGQHAPTILLDGDAIPLSLLGEGMRSTLAWLADLLVRLHRISWANQEISPLEQDFWLILDEIDESLHPTMQMRILPALRRLFPNARMYVTTHSPFVVASAGEGHVFSINPDARHRVSGTIEARRLEPGQSLEWVVEEVFGAQTGFIDPWTRDALRAHRADVNKLRRKEDLGGEGWRAFFYRRAKLMHLNEQVQTVVAMQEVPVQSVVEAKAASAA